MKGLQRLKSLWEVQQIVLTILIWKQTRGLKHGKKMLLLNIPTTSVMQLTCLACRSALEGRLGLAAGLTGALRLPPASIARIDASHFMLMMMMKKATQLCPGKMSGKGRNLVQKGENLANTACRSA